MKKIISLLFISSLLLYGCSVARHSNATKNASLDKYKYFSVIGTMPVNSSTGIIYGSNGYVYGSSSSRSTNPADIISGYLMKMGLVRLQSVSDNTADKTLIVSYGENGKHAEWIGTSKEITLQFLDGATNEIVATSTAAGMGYTESDDVRKAVLRALKNVFEPK